MKSHSEHFIILSPIGEIEVSLLSAIAHSIKRIFGFPTQISSLFSDISFAYDNNRNQYNSTQILNQLSTFLPENASKILAITDVDLFIPILTYVYGEAQLGGISAILSVHRLTESTPLINSDAIISERICKEAIHEIGHIFNLKHCKDPACIMHYCRCIGDVDCKSDQLCRYCQILLTDELVKYKKVNNCD
ncbi:MAG: peptidase M54 [Desulfobacterium sp.]|nr:peptidase M54 [Desulfobacterium sp.]